MTADYASLRPLIANTYHSTVPIVDSEWGYSLEDGLTQQGQADYLAHASGQSQPEDTAFDLVRLEGPRQQPNQPIRPDYVHRLLWDVDGGLPTETSL